MTQPRSRTPKLLLAGVLATAAWLLVLLARRDPGPKAQSIPSDATQDTARPSPVIIESARDPAPVGVTAGTPPHEQRGIARVIALDDDLKPVPDVEIWLDRRATDGDGFDTCAPHLRGTSGPDGAIRFANLPGGNYVVHARHEMLVHCHRRRTEMRVDPQYPVLKVGAGPAELVIYLTMPVVCGIELVGASIFYDSFYTSGAGYHTPPNGDGAWSCQRIKTRLQTAFPGSRCNVSVRDLRPPGHSGQYGSYWVTAWAVGYEAFRQEVFPIPLDVFVRPIQIESWRLQPSDQFGSLRITVRNAGGIPAEGLKYSIGTPMRLWRHDQPEVHFLPLTAGETVELPVGEYDLQCEGDFQAQHPALSRRNLKVERGRLTEVVIDSPVRWSRCQFRFRGAGKTDALKGGLIALKHLETGITVSKLVNRFTPPVSLWLPEGSFMLRAECYSSKRDMIWRYPDEVVYIAGGTLESPQVVSREMVLMKR